MKRGDCSAPDAHRAIFISHHRHGTRGQVPAHLYWHATYAHAARACTRSAEPFGYPRSNPLPPLLSFGEGLITYPPDSAPPIAVRGRAGSETQPGTTVDSVALEASDHVKLDGCISKGRPSRNRGNGSYLPESLRTLGEAPITSKGPDALPRPTSPPGNRALPGVRYSGRRLLAVARTAVARLAFGRGGFRIRGRVPPYRRARRCCLARRSSLRVMKMACAGCGCVVEQALVVKPCGDYPNCCCREVPAGANRSVPTDPYDGEEGTTSRRSYR